MTKDNHEGYLTTTKPEHPHLRRLADVFAQDTQVLERKEVEYGASWKKRGGIGAFMMLARKWDRLQTQLEKLYHYDIFEAIRNDHREEGVLDDIQDLRRYLALIEAECIEQGWMPAQKLLSDKEWKDLNIASANHAFHPVTGEPEKPDTFDVDPVLKEAEMLLNKKAPWEPHREHFDGKKQEWIKDPDPSDRPLTEMIKNDGVDNTPCAQCSHPKFQHQMLEGRCTWTHSPMMGCACQHFRHPASVA